MAITNEQSGRVSLSQVADRLNLSKATVSRVYNNVPNSGIAQSTRKRVMKVIREMGYEPNLSARALAQQKTHVIAAMFINVNNPFVAGFVSAAEERARQAGYHLLLCNTKNNPDRAAEECRMLRLRGIEGIIIEHGHGATDYIAQMVKANYPVVSLGERPEIPNINCVSFDDVEGARLATRALIDAGRTRIAHLAYQPDTYALGADRLEGYRRALREAQIPMREEWIAIAEQCEDVDAGRAAAGRLLDLPERPDGIFCFDDMMAIGVCQEAQKRGIRIPEDLSLIGCSDYPFCQWTSIPLASMSLDMERLGQEATRVLLEMIEQGPDTPPQSVVLTPTVVPRASLSLQYR